QYREETRISELIGDGAKPVCSAAFRRRFSHIHSGTGLKNEDNRRFRYSLWIRNPCMELCAARHGDIHPFPFSWRLRDGLCSHEEIRRQVRPFLLHVRTLVILIARGAASSASSRRRARLSGE